MIEPRGPQQHCGGANASARPPPQPPRPCQKRHRDVDKSRHLLAADSVPGAAFPISTASNLGFAALMLDAELKFTPLIFAWGAGITAIALAVASYLTDPTLTMVALTFCIFAVF